MKTGSVSLAPKTCLHLALNVPRLVQAICRYMLRHITTQPLPLLFVQMPHRNIISWTVLIQGYAQRGKLEDCFRLFSQMLPHLRPNDFTYSSVLSVCDYWHGLQVHGLALKIGFDAWIYVANVMIEFYWKNSCSAEAWRVFEDMNSPNLVTYNSMIKGLGMREQGLKAMLLFVRMLCDGLEFDRITILSLISSLCELNESTDRVVGLKCCLQLHSAGIKTGLVPDVGVTTSLIKGYSALAGDNSACHKLFLETSGVERDIVLWTGIMTASVERDSAQVLVSFSQMRLQENLRLDCYVFTILFKACANLVTERAASAVHCPVVKAGFIHVVELNSALIHAYARCGSIDNAEQVFYEMSARDIVTWNSMLKAYAVHGKAEMALNFFKQIDVALDEATFVALLSSCSHAGMVEEGTLLFDTMYETYGACRKHGEKKAAELASTRLKELNPENPFGYVMISNIYCSANSFDEGGFVRTAMDKAGVRKEPGLSCTEVGHRMHEFASGGQRQPQLKEICAYMEELLRQLKEIGYVPETSSVVFDVEEEHKEEQLYLHSEKLALVFSLMNGGSCGVIKIIKNIRICLDCHNFMRLASKLLDKAIIIRDVNRFHHFKEGACSCNDYW